MSSPLSSRVEAILQRILGISVELGVPQSRVETLLLAVMDEISKLQKATIWLGVTTTPLTEGSSTNPIMINGEEVYADDGAITSYNNDEFIFNGTVWQAFGGGGGPIDDRDYVKKSELKGVTGESVTDVMHQAAVTNELATKQLEINEILNLISALDSRVEALENQTYSEVTYDSDGYISISGGTDYVDEDGYLVIGGSIDENGILSFSQSGGGGDISNLNIVITSGNLTISGDNATVEDGKLIFDSSITGVLNFTGKDDPGSSDVTYDSDTGFLVMNGVSYENGYLDLVGATIDNDENVVF